MARYKKIPKSELDEMKSGMAERGMLHDNETALTVLAAWYDVDRIEVKGYEGKIVYDRRTR